MTKKQSMWFFILGIIYSALVSSLGEIRNSYFLAHTLGFTSLIYVFWILITNENNGYRK